ncbi:transcriptional regulator GcvA [Hyphomonas sp.]|jgi:LysR family glycine cleavage system transcriptional activator|uniref:transcriptional regulator GcvA n=1 Tax=Hyphomonas sp. TaxID=87 RepID=UPI00356997D2
MKRKLPPLTALRAFEAAARLGSFREAADELSVSQSAISHQVKHLEEQLGIALFVRTPRAVELSDAGAAYFPVVRRAFDRIAEGTKQLLSPQEENILTVQMYSTFAVRWFMPRLHAFQKMHSDIKVRVNSSQTDADFSEHGIDLALMIGQRRRDEIHYEYLFSPTMLAVCSPRYKGTAQSDGRPLEMPADLAGHPILQVYPSDNDWPVWLEANKVHDVDPDAGLRFDSYDHALKMAARGMGVALAMQPYVDEDIEAGHLVDIFPERRVRTIGHWFLTYPKERMNVRKVRLFQEWLKGQISEDPTLLPLIDGAMAAPGASGS